jgi:large subunit ribosomal protein L9
MEVILQEEVPNLGQIGDIVRVRDGYARNYLLPRGLAIVADRRNLRVLEHQKRVAAVKFDRQRRASEVLARQLAQVMLVVKARVGEEGRLFGSVTNMDLERLLSDRGFAISRRKILLEDPIKNVGSYTVASQVARDLQAAISVTVEAEESEA